MSEFLGEEFIRVRPNASTFRAELEAQIAGALAGVGPQIAAAQSRLTRTAAGSATLGGLPAATNAAVLAQTRLGSATKATDAQLAVLSSRSRGAATATAGMHREIQNAETAAGRYTRGMVAATAASSGLFRAVSFASGAFLVGALAGGAAAAGVKRFADELRLTAQTSALLKATGDAAHVSATQVAELARAEQGLTGVSRDQVQAASNILLTFRNVRNETGRLNNVFDRAVKGVVDISSVFKTDLRGSAVQLGKALQDPVRGVTALRRSGITLSQSQRELIKRLVETGRILTAQKIILGEVERQVGGTARAIGNTLPGKLDILKARARDALGEYAKRVSESQQASVLAAEGAQGLSQTFDALRAVVKALGPPLLATVQAFGQATQAVGGVGTLLVAAVAYKSVSVAIGLATRAQALYARAALIGAGATTAETRAVATSTAAFRLQTTAASVSTLGTTAASASVGLRALRIGSAALGGPIGIAAIGVVGLTIGLIKLRQAAQNAPGTLNATKRALDSLSDSVERAAKLQSQLAGKRENVSIANFNVQAAQRDLTRAQGTQARSGAAPGSLEAVVLTDRVTAAEQKLAQANRELATAARQRDIAEGQAAGNQRSRQFVIANTTKALLAQVDALGRQQRIVSLFGVPVGIRLFPRELSEPTKLRNFTALMDKLAKSGKPIERQVGGALETVRTVLDRLPTRKQIALVVRLTGQGLTTNQVLAALGIGREAGTEQIRLRGLAAAPSPSADREQQFLAAKAALHTERERLKTLRDTAAKRRDELATVRETVRADREALQGARDARQSAIEGLQDARRALRDAQQNLLDTVRQSHEAIAQAIHDSQQAVADAIRNSRDAVNSAVQSAKQNLDSLGQAIGDALTAFAEKRDKALGGSGRLGKNFQALKAQILAGGGGPETQQAAQRIAFRLSAKTPAVDTPKITQGFADLTDKLNRGKITLPQFNRQLAALLKGFDFRAFRRQFGSAAANLLRDEIRNLRQQARLILTGPQRPGGGTEPALVRPLQAVAAGEKAIAAARRDGAKEIATARQQAAKDIAGGHRDVADAVRAVGRSERTVQRANQDLADAQRKLARDQAKETKANTIAMKANSQVTQKLVDVLLAQQKLEGPRRKPKGDAGKTAGDLTNSGAGAP